jgi:hypothetical protein
MKSSTGSFSYLFATPLYGTSFSLDFQQVHSAEKKKRKDNGSTGRREK